MNQQQRDEMHNAMMEDFSDVIAKHFPNFDNNIEDQTWSFLVLFTEETIHQLSAKDFGDCQLCGWVILNGLSVEPFGNCCDKCVAELQGAKSQADVVKQVIDATTQKDKVCDVCQTKENLLTESEKTNLRSDWAGVDFYSAICGNCWEIQKATR